MSTIGDKFSACLEDSRASFLWSDVWMNKTLCIKNHRLGFLHRVLLIFAVMMVAANVVFNQPWWQNYNPDARGLEIWAVERLSGEQVVCPEGSAMSRYAYSHGPGYDYNPDRCSELPAGESFRKVAGTIDFATYGDDLHVRRILTSDGCEAMRAECDTRHGSLSIQPIQTEKIGPTAQARVSDQNWTHVCTCRSNEQFIVENVENHEIWLNHGYKVMKDMSGLRVERGRSVEGTVESVDYSGGSENTQGHSQGIMTIIKTPEGVECTVGGKSRWTGGEEIHGTLGEWLTCGGTNLDDEVPELRISTSVGVPRARITGVALDLTLHYSNYRDQVEGHSGIVCTLVVNTVPIWNSWTSMNYEIIPSTTYSQEPTEYRYRYTYGVSVSMKVEGNFGFFDWTLFFTAIMTNLFVLSFPSKFVRLVALYGAGLASDIYSRALEQKLNIKDELHGYCTRIMGHAQSFRGITGSTTQVEKPLREGDLQKNMLQAFESCRHEVDELRQEEVSMLAKVVLLGCDVDCSGTIREKEYIFAASRNEMLRMAEVLAFFDVNRRKSRLERVFGDSDFDPEEIKKRVLRSKSLLHDDDMEELEEQRADQKHEVVSDADLKIFDETQQGQSQGIAQSFDYGRVSEVVKRELQNSITSATNQLRSELFQMLSAWEEHQTMSGPAKAQQSQPSQPSQPSSGPFATLAKQVSPRSLSPRSLALWPGSRTGMPSPRMSSPRARPSIRASTPRSIPREGSWLSSDQSEASCLSSGRRKRVRQNTNKIPQVQGYEDTQRASMDEGSRLSDTINSQAMLQRKYGDYQAGCGSLSAKARGPASRDANDGSPEGTWKESVRGRHIQAAQVGRPTSADMNWRFGQQSPRGGYMI